MQLLTKALAFASLCSALLLASCQKDKIWTSREALLRFEMDTLSFDTVFTNMGSATKWFKVYNPYDKSIEISRIRLAGGSGSDFNLNIDGVNGYVSENIVLRPNDSLYIFATVRIDPTNGDAIRSDSILFELNGNTQAVQLQAYGWNAIYLGRIGDTTIYQNTNVTWSGNVPIVLFGWHVFENTTLNIAPNTHIYMYGGPTSRPAARAMLYIGDNSTIKVGVNGSFANPVIIRTHRLEEDFAEYTAHHDGIYLSRYSINNQIHNCIIRNAFDAVRVDSLAENGAVKLDMQNVFIYNVERSGILGRQGSLTARNCIIANSNKYDVVLIKGGQYDFTHCTFVNYATSSFTSRSEPVLSLRDYEMLTDAQGNQYAITADGAINFVNCIIYGNRGEELEAGQALGSTSQFNFTFDHCLIRRDTFSRGFQNCILNQDPKFKDIHGYNYSLDSTTSPAYNAGRATGVTVDILNQFRDANPDIGAYEWIP